MEDVLAIPVPAIEDEEYFEMDCNELAPDEECEGCGELIGECECEPEGPGV